MMKMMLYFFLLIFFIFLLFYVWKYWKFRKFFIYKREKSSSFECGFDGKFSFRTSFSFRFFYILMMFLMFDVELMLLMSLPLMSYNKIIFLNQSFIIIMFVLIFGLALEWMKGALDWKI